MIQEEVEIKYYGDNVETLGIAVVGTAKVISEDLF